MQDDERSLYPGRSLGARRYVLVEDATAEIAGPVRYWRAHDGILDRDVALTVWLREAGFSEDGAADGGPAQALSRYVRTITSVSSSSVPLLFDMLREPDLRAASVGAVLVSAWTTGTPLVEVLRGGPVAVPRACRMVLPLLDAAEQAARTDVCLGLEIPQRLRVDEQDTVVVAFAGPVSNGSPVDAVRGVATILYALLTGDWPAAPEAAAPLGPSVPAELASAIMLSLAGRGAHALRTCAPLREILTAYAAANPAGATTPRTTVTPHPVRTRPALRHHARRAAALVTAFVLAIATLTWTTIELAEAPLSAESVAPQVPARTSSVYPSGAVASATATPPPATTAQEPAPTVVPDSLTAYVVHGAPDNPAQLSELLGTAPGASWSTDQYRQQLPAYQPGVGIMATFGEAVQPRAVTIVSPSPGTVVEVRAAAATNSPLSQTTLLGTAALSDGTTTIQLSSGVSTTVLLVWITRLAVGSGGYQSTFDQISYQATS